MTLLEQDQTQTLAEAGDGWPAIKGLRMVLLGRLDEAPLDIAAQLIIVVNQGEVDFDTLLHGGSREPLRHPVPGRLVGQVLPDLGQMVWPVGLLHVGQECGALTCQREAAPAQVAGGPHRGGIDVGLWEHPATQQNSEFLGVDRVVFGLAAVDRLHIQRVPEDKGQLFLGPEVGEPVPGQDAFDSDDQILPLGGHGLEPRLRTGVHVAMQQDLAVLAEDTPVHAASRHIHAALRLVLFGVESHEVSSSS
jgi:hypothetical protein